jgi:hypothetical protein
MRNFGAQIGRYFAVSAVLLVFAGCSTNPIAYSKARPVPPDRILDGYRAISTMTAKTAQVSIVRDSGVMGSAISAELSVNDIAIAKFRAGERLVVYLQPGTYTFGVAYVGLLGPLPYTKQISVQSGQHYFIRIKPVAGNGFVLQPSAEING